MKQRLTAGPQKGPMQKSKLRIKYDCLVDSQPLAKQIFRPFLLFRSPLRRFYYMKRGRGRWHMPYRVLGGMRWNYYLLKGKRTPKLKRLETVKTAVLSGVLASTKLEKSRSLVLDELKTKAIVMRKDRKERSRVEAEGHADAPQKAFSLIRPEGIELRQSISERRTELPEPSSGTLKQGSIQSREAAVEVHTSEIASKPRDQSIKPGYFPILQNIIFQQKANREEIKRVENKEKPALIILPTLSQLRILQNCAAAREQITLIPQQAIKVTVNARTKSRISNQRSRTKSTKIIGCRIEIPSLRMISQNRTKEKQGFKQTQKTETPIELPGTAIQKTEIPVIKKSSAYLEYQKRRFVQLKVAVAGATLPD